MSTIRDLQPGDFEAVMDMLKFLRAESSEYDHVTEEPEYVHANMHQLWNAGALFGSVCERGCMVGCIGNTWFSRNLEATEQILFVYPPYRGSSTAVRLIQHFEQAARNKGAELLHVGITTGLEVAKTQRLYERLGYALKGTSLTKRL